jgi:hypothetical protein
VQSFEKISEGKGRNLGLILFNLTEETGAFWIL